MKLAEVAHGRCNEHVAYTLIMVPDSLTEDELEGAALRARNNYLEDAQAFKQSKPSPGFSIPNYSQYPDHMTMREIRQDLEEKKQANKEWEEKRRKASKSFIYYLLDEIEGCKLLENAVELTARVDWGHNHGLKIDYGEYEDRDVKGESSSTYSHP